MNKFATDLYNDLKAQKIEGFDLGSISRCIMGEAGRRLGQSSSPFDAKTYAALGLSMALGESLGLPGVHAEFPASARRPQWHGSIVWGYNCSLYAATQSQAADALEYACAMAVAQGVPQ